MGGVVRFRLLGVPVAIEPGFWLMSALLGWRGMSGLREMALWVVCVLAAVVVHEMGHALVARAYGGSPQVTLYTMGGVTQTHPSRPMTAGQRALVSGAGPLFGFMFGGVSVAAIVVIPLLTGASMSAKAGEGPPWAMWAAIALSNLIWINFVWGAINLLPVLPLDGGGVLRAIASRKSDATGLKVALWTTAVIAPLVALGGYLWRGSLWMALLFGMFAYSAIRQLIGMRARLTDQSAGLESVFEMATKLADNGELAEAERLAKDVAQRASNPSLRAAAAHLSAFCLLNMDRPAEAVDALRVLPQSQVDDMLYGCALLSAGRAEDAVPFLHSAAKRGTHPKAQEALDQALAESGRAGERL